MPIENDKAPVAKGKFALYFSASITVVFGIGSEQIKMVILTISRSIENSQPKASTRAGATKNLKMTITHNIRLIFIFLMPDINIIVPTISMAKPEVMPDK